MQYSNHLTSLLASRVTSPTAHQVILESGSYNALADLAANTSISKEIWWALAKVKSNSYITSRLTSVKRDLDEEQIRYLLKDRRSTILENVFANCLGNASDELAIEIIKSRLSTGTGSMTYLYKWTLSGTTSDPVARELASIYPYGPTLDMIANRPEAFPKELAAELVLANRSLSTLTYSLWELVDARPDLTDALVGTQNPYLLEAISGSRHIFSQDDFRQIFQSVLRSDYKNSKERRFYSDTLANLLANPNVGLQLKAEVRKEIGTVVENHRQINGSNSLMIDNRKIVDGYDESVGNPFMKLTSPLTPPQEAVTQDWETLDADTRASLLQGYTRHILLHLRYRSQEWLKVQPKVRAKSPNARLIPGIDEQQLELTQVHVSKQYELVKLTKSQIEQGIQAPLDAIGKDAWSTLLALSGDWDATLAELIDTTTSVSAPH